MGSVELSERAWHTLYSESRLSGVGVVTVTLKQGMYKLAPEDSTEVIDYIPSVREQLEREDDEKVESKSDSYSE